MGESEIAQDARAYGKKAWGYRHVVLFIIWLLYIINYFDRISVLTFLPLIQKDLSLNAVEIGWLGSIFFFGYSLAQFSSGYLTDKLGPKKTMNIAIWVFTFVTFLTGYVRTFTQFIILRLGLSLGEGHHYVPANKTIANWFPREEKARANGFLSTSWAVAPAIVPILVTWMAADLFDGSWRPVFFVLAIPGLIGIVILWKYVSDHPEDMLKNNLMKKEEYQLISSSVGEAVTNGAAKTYSSKMFTTDLTFWLYVVALFFMTMIYWGITTWLSTFLVKQHGLNLKAMGLVASVPYIVAFISMNIGGWLSDKIFKGNPKPVIMIAFLGSIIPLLYLANIPKGETTALILTLAAEGFFFNLLMGPIYSIPAYRYPKELVGRTMGVANGIAQFGAFVSPVVAGYLVIARPDNSYDFIYVFIFWAIVSLLGAISTIFLRPSSILDPSSFETTKNR